jgi:hypothetical protein
MRVTIPDEVLAPYEAIAERQGRPVETVVADQLARFAALVPGERAVVLGDADLTTLAAALDLAQIRDAKQLVARVERFGAVTFESVHLRLGPAQKAELARRAERQGRTVRELVTEIVARLTQDFFWATGAGEPAAAPARKAG